MLSQEHTGPSRCSGLDHGRRGRGLVGGGGCEEEKKRREQSCTTQEQRSRSKAGGNTGLGNQRMWVRRAKQVCNTRNTQSMRTKRPPRGRGRATMRMGVMRSWLGSNFGVWESWWCKRSSSPLSTDAWRVLSSEPGSACALSPKGFNVALNASCFRASRSFEGRKIKTRQMEHRTVK